MQVLRAALFNLLFWLWSVVMVVALLPAAPFLSPAGVRAYARVWERGIHALLGWIVGLRHEVRGAPPPEPCLLAAKHQSAWETLALHVIVPNLAVGLKEELTRIPLFGWYLMKAQNIRIDRGAAAAALRSLVAGAKAALDQGLHVLVFPEGTRRPPGAPPDYKVGVAALYLQLGVPCVPIALNSGVFWGRRAFLKRPGTIVVEFLEPIPPGLKRAEFMRLLEERIETATARLVAEAEGRRAGGDRTGVRAA